MKKIIIVLVSFAGLVSMLGCNMNVPGVKDANGYLIPAGYRLCTSDLQCPSPQYCSFVAAGSYAVCKGSVEDSLQDVR